MNIKRFIFNVLLFVFHGIALLLATFLLTTIPMPTWVMVILWLIIIFGLGISLFTFYRK